MPRVGFAADAKHASKYLEVKIEDGQANDRVVGMHHMIAIRRKLNDRLTDSVGTALTCGGVYQDSATFSTLVSECTMEHFGCSEEEARVFLESDINQPTKQRGGGSKARSSSSSSEYASGSKQKKAEPTIVHAGSLLLAVQPHLVEAIKKKVIAAFFVAVGLQISTVTLIQVLQWLAKNKYTASDVGHKAVRAGVKAMFAYLGVSDRELDDDVGSRTVLNISIGHYALASCFIQHCMELAVAKAYKKRTRRTGAEPGLYLLWRLELLRVHKFMEHDSNAHYGLASLMAIARTASACRRLKTRWWRTCKVSRRIKREATSACCTACWPSRSEPWRIVAARLKDAHGRGHDRKRRLGGRRGGCRRCDERERVGAVGSGRRCRERGRVGGLGRGRRCGGEARVIEMASAGVVWRASTGRVTPLRWLGACGSSHLQPALRFSGTARC